MAAPVHRQQLKLVAADPSRSIAQALVADSDFDDFAFELLKRANRKMEDLERPNVRRLSPGWCLWPQPGRYSTGYTGVMR
jgi:hypothetical protein